MTTLHVESIDISKVTFWSACLKVKNILKNKSSPPNEFLRKGILKTYSRFTEEHPCQNVISMNLQSNFIEITYGCSPLNELCIFRTSFPKDTSGGLVENIFPHQLFVQRSRLELRLTFTVNINVHYWGYVYPKC